MTTKHIRKLVTLGGFDALVEHCKVSGGEVCRLEGQGSVILFTPGTSIPPFQTSQKKVVRYPLPPRYRADLHNVLMHGSFVLLTNQNYLVSQGIRYSGQAISRLARNNAQGAVTSIEIDVDPMPEVVEETAVLMGPLGHYGHFSIETQERIPTILEWPEALKAVRVVSGHASPAVEKTFDILGVPLGRRFSIQPDKWYRFRRLLVPSIASQRPALSDWPIRKLRHRFPKPRVDSSRSRIFLDRAGMDKRQLGNQGALLPLLREAGFTIVQPETLDLTEQIELFSNAAVVLGVIGSGFYNAVWCRPGTRVAMIVNTGYLSDCMNNCMPGDAEMLFSYFHGLELNPVLLGASESAASGSTGLASYRYDRDVVLPMEYLTRFLEEL
jgi:capsular polysaccharide biosynthesis protein